MNRLLRAQIQFIFIAVVMSLSLLYATAFLVVGADRRARKAGRR